MDLIRPPNVDIHFRFTACVFLVVPVSAEIGFTDKSAAADNSKRPYFLAFCSAANRRTRSWSNNNSIGSSDPDTLSDSGCPIKTATQLMS